MSFRLKLIISITLLIAVTFGIGGTLLISTSFNSILNEEKNSALRSYEAVRNTLYLIGAFSEESNHDGMADALEQMQRQNMSSWQVLSLKADEETIYVSGDINLITKELPINGQNQSSSVIVSDNNGYGFLIKGMIILEDEHLSLSARYDLTSAYEARKVQQNMFVIAYAIVISLGIFISIVISFALTRQLRRLTNTARQISSGDLSKRSGIKSNDEIGQLSGNFDTMADRLEENIKRLEEDVQRQENFMGAFAHELKTPMTSIIGYADLLRQEGLEDNDRTAAADYIYTEGKRLEKLSFKLLDLMLMEKDSFEMKEMSLTSLFKHISKALAPVMEKKGIRLVCRCGRGKAFMEPDLIKSLIYNLIDNASKAIEKNGVIIIEGKVISGGFRIKVIDNGRGMEKEELSRITEAFYRVDKSRSRRQGGAGLGLALSKKIVDIHNGSMSFNSKVGEGTCVTIELYTDNYNNSVISEE